jgi:hypothetical protein
MIDCARLVFSLGSVRANSFRQQAEKVVQQLDLDKCGLEGRARALRIEQTLCMMVKVARK